MESRDSRTANIKRIEENIGPQNSTGNAQLFGGFDQSFFCPACALGNSIVLVGRQLLKQGKKFPVSAVAHGDGGISTKAGMLGAADRRSAEDCAEFFPGHFG